MNIQQIPSTPAGGQYPNIANNGRAVSTAPFSSPQPLALVRYDPKIAQQRLAEAQAINQAKSPLITPRKPINPFAPVPDNRPTTTNQPKQLQVTAPPTAPAPLPSPQPLALVRYDPRVAQQRLAEAQAISQAKSPIIAPKKPVNPFAPASDTVANNINQPKQITAPANAPAQVQGNNSQALALKANKPQPSPELSSLGDVFEKILKNQQMLEAKVLILEGENQKLKAAYERLQTEMKPVNPIDLNKAR